MGSSIISTLKNTWGTSIALDPLSFLALPQIEWVNIFIEPANTPLSVIPATKSPGAILNSQRLARRAKGRTPEVTQVSSVF
jgi:hypothetical protein